MIHSAYSKERLAAIEAVRRACKVCTNVQASLVSAETLAKKDKSPVTVADFGAQVVVIDHLLTTLGEQRVVGEEDSADLAASELLAKVVHQVRHIRADLSERQIIDLLDHGAYAGGPKGVHWTLDPIDGTKGFLRSEQYAVALALIEDRQVVLGVLGCPNFPWNPKDPQTARGCLFIAVKGQGVVARPLNGTDVEVPVRVDGIADPAEARFCESVESGHSSHNDSAAIATLLGVTAEPCRMDSQCKYAAVARGDASIYLRLPTLAGYEEKIWDHAAGWMVIQEAGGQVTDIRGRQLDFSLGRTLAANQGVVATNGHLHARVIAAVGKVLQL